MGCKLRFHLSQVPRLKLRFHLKNPGELETFVYFWPDVAQKSWSAHIKPSQDQFSFCKCGKASVPHHL